MLRRMRRIFWAWIPHTCRFGRVAKVTTGNGPPQYGAACRRCGAVVWFNVKG